MEMQRGHMSTSQAGHLVLEGLVKKFDEVTAVADVSLTVPEGELIALLGPSGCGKTTTLRMVAGFIQPTQGRILVDGKDITQLPPYKRGMGMVFQSYALFPHMDVYGNVVFGLQMAKVPKSEARERVMAALKRVRLDQYAKRRISELSGGQQQRVALARALVTEPTVLLLDEPLSNLDAKLRDEMRDEIRSIQQDIGITTLFVTHDQVEALTMSDRVVVLNEGAVEQIGTPERIYEHPGTRFVADFIGRANFFPASVEASDATESRLTFAGGTTTVPVPITGHKEVSVMVRPHRIQLDAAGEKFAGSVKSVTYLGDIIQYDIDLGGTSIAVEVSSKSGLGQRFSVGQGVSVSWQQDDAMVFDPNGSVISA